MLDEAARDLDAGIAGGADARFSGVALHWLRGLIHLARGDESRALADLEQELANEARGHLYARECCANACYAIGVMHWRGGRRTDAREAFDRAVQRVPKHPLARLGRAIADGSSMPVAASSATASRSMEEVFGIAAGHVLAGSPAAAAQLIEDALSAAPPSSAGWLLPVEPFLNVHASRATWDAALGRLAKRAM